MRSRPLALAVIVVLAYQVVIGVAQFVDAEQGPARQHATVPSAESPAHTEITYVHGYQAPEAGRAGGSGGSQSRAGGEKWVARTVAPAVWETPTAFSLPAAVAMADLIVVGTVQAVQFRADGDTLVTFAMERALKGQAGAQVTIAWPGGLHPSENGRGAPVLADSAGTPLLLQGERAVLLLRPDAEQVDVYRVQAFTGHYAVRRGMVQTVAGNPFGWLFEGMPEAVLVEAVLAEVR